jgi:cytochrome c oxidase subunit 1
VARVQPYLWFLGMLLFSIPTHVTGLLGMPRRVYESGYGGSAAAEGWKVLTGMSAVGGLFLFLSAAFYVMVMVFSAFARKDAAVAVEFAEPLEPPAEKTRYLDRFGLWAAVAVALVIAAYAWPIWRHLEMERFGSPGYPP